MLKGVWIFPVSQMFGGDETMAMGERAATDGAGQQAAVDLRKIEAVLFDMDGVLYVGNRPLPGVQALFNALAASGRRCLCVTNNASLSAAHFADKLARMDVHVPPGQILGSADATAAWLADQVKEHGAPNGPVFVMGMDGLREALRAQGFALTTDPFAATWMVAGANFNLTFNDLADAALAVRNGARFVGTNPDLTFPSERGQIPGTGSVLALLQAATGVQPIVIGKPNVPMFELAMRRVRSTPATTMMVGDRYDTDIAGAATLGMTTVGVLTGISTEAEFRAQTLPPQFILPGLPQLLELFQSAGSPAGV
jgi:4-nitrophenyl phosphatase